MEHCLGMGVDGIIVELILKLHKPLYGIRQERKNWFDILNNVLSGRCYHKYQVDACVHYRKDSVI